MLTLASDGDNLVGLWIEGQKYYGHALIKEAVRRDEPPVFASAKNWLGRYFAGENPDIHKLPLSPKGSEFRRRVWKILTEIPYGEVIAYGHIAKIIAAEKGKTAMSAQAVGGAVGHNPISIIIPCHRVVGANGNLTGYAGGIDVKRRLLELEGVDTGRLFAPKSKS